MLTLRVCNIRPQWCVSPIATMLVFNERRIELRAARARGHARMECALVLNSVLYVPSCRTLKLCVALSCARRGLLGGAHLGALPAASASFFLSLLLFCGAILMNCYL